MIDCVSASEFLGQAVVTMDEVRRIPSNRQIIPLTSSRSGAGITTTGSVTVEVRPDLAFFIFVSLPILWAGHSEPACRQLLVDFLANCGIGMAYHGGLSVSLSLCLSVYLCVILANT